MSALKIKWSSPNLTRHGRQGQPQHGVDIYGEDHLGLFVGVQCKLVEDNLDIPAIKEEVAKAEYFEPRIKAFYIATTAPSDSRLQQTVRLLSAERVKQDLFPVGIFFWHDLVQELVKNLPEFKKHYPQLTVEPEQKPTGTHLLSLLDITFYGLSLSDYIWLLFGDIGRSFPENPYDFQALTIIIEGCATVLFDTDSANKLVAMCRDLREYCVPYALGKEDRPEGWQPANVLAQSIEQIIRNLEYTLTGKDLAAFVAGRELGIWDSRIAPSDEKLSPELERRICDSIKVLSPDSAVPVEILQQIGDYKKTWNEDIRAVNIPSRVHGLVKTMLRCQEMHVMPNKTGKGWRRKHAKA